MSHETLVARVLAASPKGLAKSTKLTATIAGVLGIVGVVLALVSGATNALWTAIMTTTVLVMGLAAVGVVVSAIFQLTGAKWGRAYRRLAELSVALVPLGLVGVVVILAFGGGFLPWASNHHLMGGKHLWLSRPFWDVRIVLYLVISYGVGLRFLYWSFRKDFCLPEVTSHFQGGWLMKRVTKGIESPEAEAARADRKMSRLAPVVIIAYALCFSFLGFDLIMALEPDWFSTLFGAWYFIGNIFLGFALLSLVSLVLKRRLPLGEFLDTKRQADVATLLLAFCMLNTDFFWNQYLTIWYANLPEETFYVIPRVADASLPWSTLSWVALAAFFVIPFTALVTRRVKRSAGLLTVVSLVIVVGLFLARFLEIAPPLLGVEPGGGFGQVVMPLLASGLVFVGALGAGYLLYNMVLGGVPIMPVGDEVFVAEMEAKGH